MKSKIKEAQIKLLQADKENFIIYQLDETIFDARQRVRYSWSAKREHLAVPKTTSKLNKMVVVMGAISCQTNKLIYI